MARKPKPKAKPTRKPSKRKQPPQRKRVPSKPKSKSKRKLTRTSAGKKSDKLMDYRSERSMGGYAKTGRRTPKERVRTAKRMALLIECFEKGMGRLDACKKAGISYGAFLHWYRDDGVFQLAIKKAEDVQDNHMKDEAIASIQKAMSKYWCAAAWWLERKFSGEFGKKPFIPEGGSDADVAKALHEIADGLERADTAAAAVPEGQDA